ncbi:MAG: glycosyltransferase family 4 protein [Cyanobacteria bacterium P01_C01_bin.89]
MLETALFFFPHCFYPPRTGAHARSVTTINALKSLGYKVLVVSIAHDAKWNGFYLWTQDSCNQMATDLGVDVVVIPDEADDLNQIYRNPVNAGPVVVNPPLHLLEKFKSLILQVKPTIIFNNYTRWHRLVNPLELIDEDLFDKGALPKPVSILEMHDLITVNHWLQSQVNSLIGSPPYDRALPDNAFLSFTQGTQSQDHIGGVSGECEIYDSYDITVAISRKEKALVLKNTTNTQIIYLPVVSEVKDLDSPKKGQTARRVTVVIGPNIFNFQGYLFLTQRILPCLLEKVSNIKVTIAGDACKYLKPVPGIEFLGFVEDLDRLYEETAIALCPLLNGTGQQVKVVEAMARGIPVVTMAAIAESSPIEHGVNGLIADDEEQFAQCVTFLLENPDRAMEIGLAARETIRREFSQQTLTETLGAAIESVKMRSGQHDQKKLSELREDGILPPAPEVELTQLFA